MTRIYLGAILFLMVGCAASNELGTVIDEGDGRLIRLEKVSPAPSYSHPIELDLETVRIVLNSVVVSHPNSLLKRIFTQQSEVRGAAFSPKEVDALAGPFKTALGRATPEERVAFFLTSRKDSMTTDLTSGVAFIKEKELHLILANDHTEVMKDKQPWVPFNDPLHPYEIGNFEVIPQQYQKRGASNSMKGRQEEVVLDYEGLVSNPANPAPAASDNRKDPAPSSEGSTLEERLRLLKKLKEGALITDEEYAEKKRELLKSLDTPP